MVTSVDCLERGNTSRANGLRLKLQRLLLQPALASTARQRRRLERRRRRILRLQHELERESERVEAAAV